MAAQNTKRKSSVSTTKRRESAKPSQSSAVSVANRARKDAPSAKTEHNGSKPSIPASKSETKQPKRRDSNFLYFISITLFFLSVCTFLAVLSYFTSWKEDQNFQVFADIFSDKISPARNFIGPVGAIIGNLFAGEWFGIFGLCMPLLMFVLSLLLIKIRPRLLRKIFISVLMLAIIGSVAAAYATPQYIGVFGSSLGGAFGLYFNDQMMMLFGDIGTGLLLFMLLVIWLVYTSKNTLDKALSGVWKALSVFNSWLTPKPRKPRAPMPTQSQTPNAAMIAGGDIATASVTTPAVTAGTSNAITPSDDSKIPNSMTPPAYAPIKSGAESDAIHSQSVNSRGGTLLTTTSSAAATDQFNSGGSPFDDNDEISINTSNGKNEVPMEIGEVTAVSSSGVGYTPKGTFINGMYRNDVSRPVPATRVEPIRHHNADDYSQMVDRSNLVLFRPSIVEPEPEIELHSINSTSLTHGSELRNEPEIGIKSMSTSETSMPASARIIPVTPAFVVDPPRVSKDENEMFTIETRPFFDGDPESDDDSDFNSSSKASTFEVSVTDNAEIDINNLPENVVLTTNNSEILDDIDNSVFDPTLELSRYKLPPVELLENHTKRVTVTEEELYENKNRIVETLDNFNIKIDRIKATIGPTVTLYEIVPAPGVRISKIKNLEDDIALSLSALGIRIIAPIPGKGTIGIEVPNKNKEVVSMYSAIKSAKFQESDYDLPIVLGKTVQNEDFVIDLAKMPHLLVAGATGQGKSVGLNAIITSLLYKKHPAELKFVLVDPKKVELTLYAHLEKHFLAKLPDADEAIITDTQKVIYTLNSLCSEMDSRYDLLKKAKVRNIKEYNQKFSSRRLNPNKGHHYLPYFVLIIDEFADLIMTAGREIETPIARIAQLARAVGIHLVIATQRPTTNIITGLIKANFPARIAFRVTSMIDSRTILDQPGANQLIGRGDMLVSTGNEVTRVQCAFIDTPEVERITEYIGLQQGYPSAYDLPEYVPERKDGDVDMEMSGAPSRRDGLFDEVARYVVTNQQGSASTIQRNFSIGFNRAGRIMDQLEKVGIVGRQEGSKPRQVLVSDLASLEVMLYDLDNKGN